MRRSERVTGCQSHQSEFWNSITFSAFIITVTLLINTVESGPINRQVGISENVYITVQNDTYGIEQRVCSIDSMTYSDGESIPTSSPCEHCICRPPGFACTIISCEYRAGCKAMQRSNQCCPEYKCECEKDGKIYQNGEKILDNNNPCEVCYCQGGDIICAVIDCYWRSDCQPRYIENRCCPLYDHCPQPNHPGPHRPTQRPLLTTSTTLGTTVGWFNLSSSIFASSSTPLAQFGDVSSSTTLTPAAALLPVLPSSSSASPPQENEIVASVPEVEQSQENSILPEQNIVSSSSPVPVSTETPEQQQQQEISSASPIHIEQTSENVQNNVVEPVEEEAVKDKNSNSDSLVSSSTESSVQLESGLSSSSETPVESSSIINSENVPEVSVPLSSSTTTTTTTTTTVLPQEDVQIQTSPVSINVEENEPVVEVAVATESAVPSNNLVVDEQNEPIPSSSPAQVEPSSVKVVSSPVEETITVQQTSQIPDSSIITEILPVLDSQSQSSSVVIILDSTPVSQLESVTVANLERDTTVLSSSSLVQQTEVLESVTVVNSLDIPSAVVVEPTQSLSVIIISSSGSINPSLASDSSLISVSSSILGSINVDESIDDSITTESILIDVSTPALQSSSSPSIALDSEVEKVKESVPAETPSSIVASEIESQDQNEIDITTQVVSSLEDKPFSVPVPSIELQPPNVENEIVVDDPKPSVENHQQQQPSIPAQPSLELQPPIHEAIVPVQINPIDDEPIQTTVSSSSVSDDVVTVQPELQVPSSSSSVVNQNTDDSSSSAAVVVDSDLNDDNSVGISTISSLNDPVVTEIPTESPKPVENDSPVSNGYLPLADSPSSSSIVSSTSETPVAPETESSILQDQTEGTLNDEPLIQTTQNPQVVVDQQSSSSSSSPSSVVVLPDVVNDEVTDSLPVFDETVDTIKANQQPTVSPVADEVTEIESLKSSTVPPTDSPVNISFVDLNDGASETPVTVVNGDQQQQLDLDSQDQADPIDQDSPVVTTTVPSVSIPSSSPAPVSNKVEEIVLADEVTTISSSSNDISQQSVQNDVSNDEPIAIVQTTVNSIIQADEAEKVTEVPSSIVSDGLDTNTASPVNTVVSNTNTNVNDGVDDVQSDDVASVAATTLSTISELNDESASPSEETTIRVVPASDSSIQSDVSEVQNDEPVVATTSVPSILNDLNDEGGDATTVRLAIEDIPSSDSLFRLDPSVFTDSSKENGNNNKPAPVVASLLKSTSSSSLTSDQNNENDVIFDNVVAPTTQTPEQVKSNQLLLDDLERIETTEVNQRVYDTPEQIELTTTRSSLGEDRKDFQDETTSKVVVSEDAPLEQTKLTQDDEITTATETAGNLLRHHHPDHDGFRVESTTLSQQENQRDGDNAVAADEAVEASTIFISNDDISSPIEATTITLRSKVSSTQDKGSSRDQAAESVLNDENDVEGSGQSDSTDNSVQNDETTVLPINPNLNNNNNNNSQSDESKVNSTFARKGVVVIPNELFKRPDPITDDLQVNGLGRSDPVGPMKSENPDETWFWRAVNRVRTLPDFLPTFSLSRQPRSTDSVDESSQKANAQLHTSSKNNIISNNYDNNHKKAPHRPFLFW